MVISLLLSLALPGLLLLLAIAFRWKRNVPVTTFGDVLLLLIAFDLAIVADPESKMRSVPSATMQPLLQASLVTLSVASILTLYLLVTLVESKIQQSVVSDPSPTSELKYSGFPVFRYIGGLLSLGGIVALNIFIFFAP